MLDKFFIIISQMLEKKPKQIIWCFLWTCAKCSCPFCDLLQVGNMTFARMLISRKCSCFSTFSNDGKYFCRRHNNFKFLSYLQVRFLLQLRLSSPVKVSRVGGSWRTRCQSRNNSVVGVTGREEWWNDQKGRCRIIVISLTQIKLSETRESGME